MDELQHEIPFNCIITGPTNCGKTKYLIDQLRESFRYVFDYIVLICPTYAKNKTYHGFAQSDKKFIVLSPEVDDFDEINDLLKDIKELFSGTNTLVILDDCAVSKDLEQRSNKFIDLAFSGRYHELSVWVLTQQLTSISKAFRDNVGCVIAFHSPSQISTKILFEDFGGDLDTETRKKFIEKLKSNKYSLICFCLRHPFNCYLEIPKVTI